MLLPSIGAPRPRPPSLPSGRHRRCNTREAKHVEPSVRPPAAKATPPDAHAQVPTYTTQDNTTHTHTTPRTPNTSHTIHTTPVSYLSCAHMCTCLRARHAGMQAWQSFGDGRQQRGQAWQSFGDGRQQRGQAAGGRRQDKAGVSCRRQGHERRTRGSRAPDKLQQGATRCNEMQKGAAAAAMIERGTRQLPAVAMAEAAAAAGACMISSGQG